MRISSFRRAVGISTSDPTPHYVLGSTDAEHECLIRQPALLARLTERFFREACIGPGHRILGSGVGDVSMLAARLVGPSGEVGANAMRSIARARARVAEAGLRNVTFTLAPLPETTSAFEGHREELVGDKGYHIGAVLGKPGERRSANIYFREAGEEETALGKQGRAEAGYLNDRGQQGRSKVLLEVQLPLTIVRKIISC